MERRLKFLALFIFLFSLRAVAGNEKSLQPKTCQRAIVNMPDPASRNLLRILLIRPTSSAASILEMAVATATQSPSENLDNRIKKLLARETSAYARSKVSIVDLKDLSQIAAGVADQSVDLLVANASPEGLAAIAEAKRLGLPVIAMSDSKNVASEVAKVRKAGASDCVDMRKLGRSLSWAIEAAFTPFDPSVNFSQLNRNVPEPALILDTNGRILWHNPAFAEVFLRHDQDVIDKGPTEIWGNEKGFAFSEAASNMITDLSEAESVTVDSLTAINPKDPNHRASHQYFVQRRRLLTAGNPNQRLGVVFTEMSPAKAGPLNSADDTQALQRRVADLEALIKNIPGIHFSYHPTKGLLAISPRAAEFFGVSEREALGKLPFTHLCHFVDESFWSKLNESFADFRDEFGGVVAIRDRSHGVRVVNLSLVAIRDSERRIQTVHVSVFDVSEYLDKIEGMERDIANNSNARNTIMKLISGEIHELRGKVRMIMGAGESLQDASTTQFERDRYYAAIPLWAVQAASLIDRLQKLGESHPGDPVPFPISLLYDSIMLEGKGRAADLKWRYEKNGKYWPFGDPQIDVSIDPSTAIGTFNSKNPAPVIFADQNEISFALAIIINNAVDAILEHKGGKGKIVIRGYTVTLPAGGPQAGEWSVTEIEDDGAGIPAHIFSVMFNEGESYKKISDGEQLGGAGSGHGLARAAHFVEKAGGFIKPFTEVTGPNKGSRFKVFLPISKQKPTDGSPVIAGQSRFGFPPEGEKFLAIVADDNEDLTTALSRQVERLGTFRVLIAHSVGELKILMEANRGNIKLVLTDWNFADGNPRDFVPELRNGNPNVVVFGMTGDGTDERVAMMNDLLDAHLIAPVRMEIFVGKLSTYFGIRNVENSGLAVSTELPLVLIIDPEAASAEVELAAKLRNHSIIRVNTLAEAEQKLEIAKDGQIRLVISPFKPEGRTAIIALSKFRTKNPNVKFIFSDPDPEKNPHADQLGDSGVVGLVKAPLAEDLPALLKLTKSALGIVEPTLKVSVQAAALAPTVLWVEPEEHNASGVSRYLKRVSGIALQTEITGEAALREFESHKVTIRVIVISRFKKQTIDDLEWVTRLPKNGNFKIVYYGALDASLPSELAHVIVRPPLDLSQAEALDAEAAFLKQLGAEALK